MGRAIDMEKDIDILKKDVAELKQILNDILNQVQEDDETETKKTNTKRSKTSSGKSDTRPSDSE
jgi:t-SNARE complex subunit (syntaxin)